MKKPDYRQSFYTTPVFLGFAILALIMLLSLLSFFKTIFHESKTATSMLATADLCQLKARIDIAKNYGVGYQLDQNFEMPAITISTTPALMRQIENDFKKLYPEEMGVISPSSLEPKLQCHLPHVKYSVANVNQRLAKFIPDDVDYVSYAPKSDKAVYCSYFFDRGVGHSVGSKCFFVQIKKDVLGKEELITDDISDMERLNLENFSSNFHAHPDTFSVIDTWEDEPKPNQIYGIVFSTRWDGSRWGIGQYY